MSRSKALNNIKAILTRAKSSLFFRGIPEPIVDVNALYHTVTALQANVEALIRDRGKIEESAVLVGDLELVVRQLEGVFLTVEDAANFFVKAAYIGMEAPVDTGFPTIGAAWQDLDFITIESVPPFKMTNEGNGRFSVDQVGTYYLVVSGAFAHNETNQGREINFRVYDYTTDTPVGDGFLVGTGRNQPATNVAAGAVYSVSEAEVGDQYGLQVGNGSTYSSVVFNAMGYDVFSVGKTGYTG